MKRLLPAIAIVAFLILPQAAQAQYLDREQLARVEEVSVAVSVPADMKGGCLPSPNVLKPNVLKVEAELEAELILRRSANVLKVEAELILRRSGITVVNNEIPVREHFVDITLTGGELTSTPSCIGNLEVLVSRFETLLEGSSGAVTAFQRARVLFGPKADFQKQLRNFVNEAVTELAKEILKARSQ